MLRVPFKGVVAATRGSAVGTWPARNDSRPNPSRGDAWVDDKQADFESMTSHRSDGLKKHLEKADRHQQVDVAYVDLRPGGMSEDTARDGLSQFSHKGRLERVVIIGRDFVIDEDF
ncbi:hypothetical protein [Streptomyces sp. NPDC014995]|uniref:hypothetical protein n=1 Tax=Streptomyces sp. NPDC014995 TaxID=3364936 RepID=UPI003700AF67